MSSLRTTKISVLAPTKMQQLLLRKICFYTAFLTCIVYAQAQSECEGVSFIGVYPAAPSDHVATVVLAKAGSTQGTGDVYTNIQLVTDAGDTLLTRTECWCHTLPQVTGDTFAYQINLHESIASFSDFPLTASGTIITEFPTCSIPFSFEREVRPSLPSKNTFDCDDYTIVGIYPRGPSNLRRFTAMIEFTDADSIGTTSGYTSFTYADAAGIPLGPATGPNYILPTFRGEFLTFEISLDMVVGRPPMGMLLLENPTCSLAFRQNTSSLLESASAQLRIYPNPSASWLFADGVDDVKQITLYDLKGSILFQGPLPADIRALPNGTYVAMLLEGSGKQSTQQVIIQR